MTSLAQLPPRGKQMARALGNRVKLLSRKSAESPTKFTALDETCAESRGGIVKNPGPLARQDGHLCPPWLWGRTLPKTTSFGEQYSRHLVDVKCITLHIVFYAFPGRTKRVTLFGFPDFQFSGLDEASEYQCHLFREPCGNTLFASRFPR
jgi:hypothetical protein